MLLTQAELARQLHLSPWTVRRWRLSEDLPFIKTGNRFLYRLSTVQSWLESKESGSVAKVEPDSFEQGRIRQVK